MMMMMIMININQLIYPCNFGQPYNYEVSSTKVIFNMNGTQNTWKHVGKYMNPFYPFGPKIHSKSSVGQLCVELT